MKNDKYLYEPKKMKKLLLELKKRQNKKSTKSFFKKIFI